MRNSLLLPLLYSVIGQSLRSILVYWLWLLSDTGLSMLHRQKKKRDMEVACQGYHLNRSTNAQVTDSLACYKRALVTGPVINDATGLSFWLWGLHPVV